MRILLVSTYFRPDVASTGVLMTGLAEELASLGHDLTVVTSKPHYGNPALIEEDFPGIPWHRKRAEDGTEVYRLSVYRPRSRGNTKERLVNYLSFEALASLRSLTVEKPDVVLIPSPPLLNGLIGDLVERFRGVPFVYNVQDIWPEFVIRSGALARDSWLGRLSVRLEHYVYDAATKVVVISEGFRRILLEKGVPAFKLEVIPNFFDVEFLTPCEKDNEFARKHDLADRFVALFAGNVGHAQDLETVLRAAESLRDVEELLILIVGEGAGKPALEALAAEKGLENVRFLPFQDHEVLPELYGSADVGLVPLQDGFEQASVPSKVYSIMSSGTPVLASVPPGSDTWKLVESTGTGVTVASGDPWALREALVELSTASEDRERMGRAGREYMVEHRTPRRIAERYERVLGEAAGRP